MSAGDATASGATDSKFGGGEDYDEKPVESLCTRNPICHGSIHHIVCFDAGKWDQQGTSLAVIAPAQASRFTGGSSMK